MSLKTRDLFLGIIVIIAAYGITTILTPKILFWRGMTLYEDKNYESSLNYMQKALIFKPDNRDYRYYYVKTLSEMKPVYKVQKTMYRFANDGKDDSANILANDKISEWKKNIHANIGNNYIEQAPSDANIIRWNKNSFPLKVYIDTKKLSDLPEYYTSAVSRALSQWDKSVDFVSFINADKKSDAQILIVFDKMPENICDESGICKFVVGYTSPKISGHKLKNMSITIYDKNPRGEYFSDKEVYNTVLHEMGHALGIMGHSYSTDDLMYLQTQGNDIFTPYREDFHYLSGNDVNTLKLLYMLEPTITDKPNTSKKGLIYTPIILGSRAEIAMKKVEEAKDYINSSPDIAVGYINLAGAYSDLKEYKKAIEALQSALDVANTDNEKFIIYYNYAYIYMNMKKYNTALEYAELAEHIQPSQDVAELISIIKHNKSVSE